MSNFHAFRFNVIFRIALSLILHMKRKNCFFFVNSFDYANVEWTFTFAYRWIKHDKRARARTITAQMVYNSPTEALKPAKMTLKIFFVDRNKHLIPSEMFFLYKFIKRSRMDEQNQHTFKKIHKIFTFNWKKKTCNKKSLIKIYQIESEINVQTKKPEEINR